MLLRHGVQEFIQKKESNPNKYHDLSFATSQALTEGNSVSSDPKVVHDAYLVSKNARELSISHLGGVELCIAE